MVQPLGKVWHLNIHLSYDPVLPLLGIYAGEIKIHVHKKTCMITPYASEHVEQQELSLLVEIQNGTATWEDSLDWWFLTKLNIFLSYDPAINRPPWYLPIGV